MGPISMSRSVINQRASPVSVLMAWEHTLVISDIKRAVINHRDGVEFGLVLIGVPPDDSR